MFNKLDKFFLIKMYKSKYFSNLIGFYCLILFSFIFMKSVYAECIYDKPLDKLTPMLPDICSFCKSGCNGNTVLHKGIDLEADKEDPVYAVCDGIVRRTASKVVYDSFLIIEHQSTAGNFFAFYGHISSSLDMNSVVEKGDVIGTVAEWVDSEGLPQPHNTHIHFGINKDNTNGPWGYGNTGESCEDLRVLGWRDPIKFLGFENSSLVVGDFYLKGTEVVEGELFDAQAKIHNNSDEDYQIDGYALEIHQADSLYCRLEFNDTPIDIAPCGYIQLSGDNTNDCNGKFIPGIYNVAVSIKKQAGWIVIAEQGLKINESPFSDISTDHPYYSAISELCKIGVIEGYPDGEFKSSNPINRAEFLKILTLTAKSSDQSLLDKVRDYVEFPDVPSNEWFEPYVREGYEAEIIDGHDDGTFGPGGNINRAEAAKMALNAFQLIEGDYKFPGDFSVTFSDVQPETENPAGGTSSTWYYEYVARCFEIGIMNKERYDPDNEKQFYPGLAMTRGEAAQLIFNAFIESK